MHLRRVGPAKGGTRRLPWPSLRSVASIANALLTRATTLRRRRSRGLDPDLTVCRITDVLAGLATFGSWITHLQEGDRRRGAHFAAAHGHDGRADGTTPRSGAGWSPRRSRSYSSRRSVARRPRHACRSGSSATAPRHVRVATPSSAAPATPLGGRLPARSAPVTRSASGARPSSCWPTASAARSQPGARPIHGPQASRSSFWDTNQGTPISWPQACPTTRQTRTAAHWESGACSSTASGLPGVCRGRACFRERRAPPRRGRRVHGARQSKAGLFQGYPRGRHDAVSGSSP
jgi:hypothetical protein